MRLPLALEVALLGGDAFLAAEQAVAAEVLVALLDETKPRLVPDQPVVQQLLQRGVDVALALEQFIPLRYAAVFVAHHAHRAADPVVHAERGSQGGGERAVSQNPNPEFPSRASYLVSKITTCHSHSIHARTSRN